MSELTENSNKSDILLDQSPNTRISSNSPYRRILKVLLPILFIVILSSIPIIVTIYSPIVIKEQILQDPELAKAISDINETLIYPGVRFVIDASLIPYRNIMSIYSMFLGLVERIQIGYKYTTQLVQAFKICIILIIILYILKQIDKLSNP